MVKYNKRYKYRDLCKALDLKPLSGSAQRKQLADLNKEYEMVKDKANNYIIKRKYSQVESIENQAYHKNKAYIEPMIYTVLSSATNNVVEFDMRQLLELLALVNENFFVAKYSIENADKIIIYTSATHFRSFNAPAYCTISLHSISFHSRNCLCAIWRTLNKISNAEENSPSCNAVFFCSC